LPISARAVSRLSTPTFVLPIEPSFAEWGNRGLGDEIVVTEPEERQVQLFDFCFHANQLLKFFGPKPDEGKVGLFAAGELSRVSLQATRREFSFKVDIPRKDFVASVGRGMWW
jgi:hypothetical protein